MGLVLYNKWFLIKKTIYSAAIDTSFDINQKDLELRTSILHHKRMIRNLQLKLEEKHKGSLFSLINTVIHIKLLDFQGGV